MLTPYSQTEPDHSSQSDHDLAPHFTLILWNDDFTPIDNVIKALEDICEHGSEQAEQCATLAHYKGKCDIKSSDSFDDLNRCKQQFDKRKITTSIE